ncbi:hypothetical protein EK0264_18000 [Epidermidibacterium keratini]|uniref:DUF6286 domain-containing protein n=1 Tax=Epidermidibacterium keratini TaxID=1891644 RepID=A0A7L4YSE4_9ACTN|nr:DUF6286 domain-containing protein [Epidermidibacterium keratini]QHC01982.1 hypothetical protein EK0264_18000 [Epidermidibacterium keratini]
MSTSQRILLRATSALVGLVLVAALVLGVGQIVAGLVSGDNFIVPTSQWYDALRTTAWDDPDVLLVGIAALIIGVLLLLVAVLTRPRLIGLRAPKDGVEVRIAPRTVAQILRRQAEAVPGIASASAEVNAGTARITADAPLAHPDYISRELERTLSHALKQIPWSQLPSLQVEISSDRGSSVVTAQPPARTDGAAQSSERR